MPETAVRDTNWGTDFETGLLDDFDFTIQHSIFSFDDRYNAGQTLLLQWEGITDNPDVPETRLWFPLGKGWVSTDGGKSVHHESGKADKYFVKNSSMARLITRCVDDFGIRELMEERGSPFESAPWVGMIFHIKMETVEYGGGNIEASTKQFPNRFVGIVEAKAAKASGSAGKGAADKIAAAKAKASKSSAPSLRDQVVAIFNSHDDFGVAQDAALQIEGVTDDDELLDAIMKPEGLWAEVKG